MDTQTTAHEWWAEGYKLTHEDGWRFNDEIRAAKKAGDTALRDRLIAMIPFPQTNHILVGIHAIPPTVDNDDIWKLMRKLEADAERYRLVALRQNAELTAAKTALQSILHTWQTQSEACADNSRCAELMAEEAREAIAQLQ